MRQKEEVRCQILDAAWQIVKEEGWQSLSMRKIADRIEYTSPIIYGHFENKEALLQEFTRKGFVKLCEMIRAAYQAHIDNAPARLEAMWMAYWNFAFANRESYQLMYGVEMGCCTIKNGIPESEECAEMINSTIQEIIASGKHPDADPCLKYFTCWSVVHGLISINITRNPEALHQSDDDSPNLNELILKDAIAGIVSQMLN
ncbi:TetR/AcrR family transcriptional regulator [Deminuibacter soli]|uniref:TetR/AcrR family transcriptional regulator n=1 Tax=Deminuibacter soli TaxID=2291815 RepID=UPI001FE90B77|nr:TetR/AcrR family transcriptional regulator [Deminuibacter soli]